MNKKGQQSISHSTAEQLNQLLYYLIYEIKNILRQVYSESSIFIDSMNILTIMFAIQSNY